MGQWGFVLLAYGVVWVVLVLYIAMLRYRLRKVEMAITLYRSRSGSKNEDK